MTASPGDVRAWRTSSLSTAVGRLAAAKLQLDTAVDDALESAVVAAESWSGVGADAALARAAQEHAQGDRVSAKLEGLIGALRDGALSLEAVRVPALAAVDAAQTESFRVDEHWMVTDPLGQAMAVLAALQGPTGLAMMAARKAALAIHQQSVADAHQALTTVDAEVEYAIDSATDELSATGNDVEEVPRCLRSSSLMTRTNGDPSPNPRSSEVVAQLRRDWGDLFTEPQHVSTERMNEFLRQFLADINARRADSLCSRLRHAVTAPSKITGNRL